MHPLLVLGAPNDMELLRTSMRVGARDFFPLPAPPEELIGALDRLAKEDHERRGGLSASVTSFVNARGGSGASFCAVNYAHILTKALRRRTLLVDFDLQFGSLPSYFNLQSRNGLIRALELAETLDAAALGGYIQQHESGLSLLTPAAEGLILPEEIPEQPVAKLFAVLDEAFEDLVVDLPRRIDQGTAAVLDRSDTIMVVTQQTVVHLQDTKRLVTLLSRSLGIAADRILIVLNRYQRREAVRPQDFMEALPGCRLHTIPDDDRRARASIDLGVPVFDSDPRSSLTKAIRALAEKATSLPGEPGVNRDSSPLRWLNRLRQ